jgi:hypothetical protein
MARKLIKVALLAVLAAALMAPIASAKRYDPPRTFPGPSSAIVSALSNIYVIGCKNGTIPGTTGGDNNNYEYYGNPCNSPVPSTGSLVGSLTLGAPTPADNNKVCGDNDNYDYYGSACSN